MQYFWSILSQISNGKEIDSHPIKVKISGDGARFTKSSTVILLSFSFPGLQNNILSGTGKAPIYKYLQNTHI